MLQDVLGLWTGLNGSGILKFGFVSFGKYSFSKTICSRLNRLV